MRQLKSVERRTLEQLAEMEKAARGETPAPATRDESGLHVVRRWEAAETTRLNEAHWKNANGQAINADLLADLRTLRARCHYEYHNNAMVEGVVNTHSLDLIGPYGPTLQVESDDDQYSETLEQVWKWWWAQPDATGKMTGPQMLQQWNLSMWLDGPILAQTVTDPAASRDDPIHTKINDITPSRLDTPPAQSGDPNVIMGVRRNDLGRPTQYYISRHDPNFPQQLSLEFDPVPPDDIIHEFAVAEPGQATGYPRLSSCLQDIADIRDFDIQELDVLRAAADTAVYFVADNPQFVQDGFERFDTTTSIARRSQRFVPLGYRPIQLTPGQPTQHALEFRKEKLRSLGRPVHMPLLLILLSAEESNFSQSRIDVNVFYERGLQVLRKWLEQRILTRLLNTIAREAELAGILPRRRFPRDPRSQALKQLVDSMMPYVPPFGIEYHWGWSPLPQANPKDHATAKKIRLETGMDTLHQALAEEGKDYQTQMEQIGQENEDRENAGMAPLGATAQGDAGGQEGDEGDSTPGKTETEGATA